MYSMDGTHLLWKGKTAKLPKGAIGRRITDTMATDGTTLYFAQKRVDVPASINLSTLRMHVFDENTFNLFGAILDDGSDVWQLNNRGAPEIVKLDGARFEDVSRLEATGVHFDYHLKDGNTVWYRGQIVEGLEAAKAIILGENIASDGKAVWFFGERSAAFGCADITPVWSTGGDDWLRTNRVFIKLESKNDKRGASLEELATASAPPKPDDIAEQALGAIAKDMFAVFETYPQIIVPIDDMEWKKIRAYSTAVITARFEGARLRIEANGIEPVICDADGWYGGICTLWLRFREREGHLITYPQAGTMSPDGQEFHRRLIKENRDLYLQLCGAVFDAGDEASARLMLQAYVNIGWFRQETPFDGQDKIIAGLPRGMFQNIAYAKRRHNFTNTTNLSAARHAIDSGLLIDADPRVRMEMLGLIHGAVISTNKPRQFFEKILPAILERQSAETVACVLEQVDIVIEAFILAGLVAAEVNHVQMADVLEPIIRSQIGRGVNIPLNGSRLIEVLIHQNQIAGADIAIASFKADYGAGFMLPGLYVNRPLHKSVDEAVAAMRQRANELN